MPVHDPLPDLPLLASIAEGEDVGDGDHAGRAEATLHLAGEDFHAAVGRLSAAGLIAVHSPQGGGPPLPSAVTPAGRARLRRVRSA